VELIKLLLNYIIIKLKKIAMNHNKMKENENLLKMNITGFNSEKCQKKEN